MTALLRGTARRGVVGVVTVVTVLTVLGALAGCGATPVPSLDASGGRLAQLADLHGARFTVGGGQTGELHVLCQLTIAAVQAAGGKAEDECGRIGSVDVRVPAAQSEVDTGWEYLGRVDRDLDGRPDPPLPPAETARLDAPLGVSVLAPTAFGDVDAVVVAPAVASTGVRSLSALAARAVAAPGSVTLCATPDAAADPGRLGAVRAAYGLPPDVPVRPLDLGAVLVGVVRGTCTAGEVPGTSGRIPALGLTALDDDRGALAAGPAGRGGAAPIVRTATLAAHPGFAALLGEITRRLDDTTMRRLDDEVEVQGRDPREVARAWLTGEGLIERG